MHDHEGDIACSSSAPNLNMEIPNAQRPSLSGYVAASAGRKLNARREASLEARSAEADRLSPQVLVNQHPHSFRLSASEVASASLDPGATISLHGPHAAVWRLTLQDGQSWRRAEAPRS